MVIRGNESLIKMYLEGGWVTEDRLREIAENEDIQTRFRELMTKARGGGDGALEAQEEIFNFSQEMRVGWLVFYRKFHEKMWNIDLLGED